MKLYTIGFTRKSAERFFTALKGKQVRRLIDVRLNNSSQLAGFAKREDLQFFLKELCGISYAHEALLAPTQGMLDAYKKTGGGWATYEAEFMELMRSRKIEEKLSKESLADACLLCSEEKPHLCHRRLVAEYLKEAWGDVDIEHI